ncbi:C40 family peptidase [Nonomuraea pusilla]|uniref:Cell wall-associated hydrolase, NlpC family n=1 Tax=Nonomuraea pusilla TaxID=46177 RepID=A0A1H7NAN5_9ACTN|nr:C40 family peptidase [Nonomuraea pusilla]SEL20686.1 Cell wall-associated hydrolase, NlpC family [Nonomuraea pusilla]
MHNPRLSRLALGALTMTVTAGGLALHAPAARAETGTVSGASASAASVATADSTTTADASSATRAGTTATTSARKTATSAKARKTARLARQTTRARKAVSVARRQIGDPYRYGATGPGSFDCSGLVQYSWKKAGVKIPRVASSQFARIRHKVSWRDLRPGDLMFFSGLGHVGMYVGHGKMIHSPRTGERVRVDKLSRWRKGSFVGAVRPGL